MAFVIQEDYVFVNEYLDDDNNDYNDDNNGYNDEKNDEKNDEIINDEIVNDDSQKILDKLINQTVNKFFHNKNTYCFNDIILFENNILKN